MPPFRYGPLALSLVALWLAGCGTSATLAPHAPQPVAVELPDVDGVHGPRLKDVDGPTSSLLTADMIVLQHLNVAHAEWDGTPYRFGAISRDGVDCSGFVQRVFAETFGMALTRSTHSQVLEGRDVPREALQPGDLVFFRTGRRTQHVGIYLRDGRFLHASTSRGVTVDRLTSGYYDRTYWTARRVLRPELVASLVELPGTTPPRLALDLPPAAASDGRPAPRPAAARRRDRPRTPPPGMPAVGGTSASTSSPDRPTGRRSGW
jgi:hypothetical protein